MLKPYVKAYKVKNVHGTKTICCKKNLIISHEYFAITS